MIKRFQQRQPGRTHEHARAHVVSPLAFARLPTTVSCCPSPPPPRLRTPGPHGYRPVGWLCLDHALNEVKRLRQVCNAREVKVARDDVGVTLADVAAEVARQTGKPTVYADIPKEAYKTALAGFGLPAHVANLLAEADADTSAGALYDGSRTLSKVTGHPTTSLADAVAAALAPSK